MYRGDMRSLAKQRMVDCSAVSISRTAMLSPPNTNELESFGEEKGSGRSMEILTCSDGVEHEEDNSFEDNSSLLPNQNSDSDRNIDSELNDSSEGALSDLGEFDAGDDNSDSSSSASSTFDDISGDDIDDVMEDFEIVDPDDSEMEQEPFEELNKAFKTDAPSFSMSMNTNDVNRVPCYLEDYLLRSDYIAHYHRDFVVRKRRLGLCARGGGGREISSRTREIVVDWLIQVQNYCGFELESLYTGVAMFDVYNAVCVPDVESVQLVAITCILIATKLHEEDHVDIGKLIHLTEDSYTKQQVLELERNLIKFFNFKLDFSTPFHYRLLYEHEDPQRRVLVDYLLELAMKELFYTQFSPLHLVESCIWAAIILQSGPASRPCISQTHVLGPPILLVLQTVQNSATDQRTGAKEKYSSEKFLSISRNPCVTQFSAAQVNIGSGLATSCGTGEVNAERCPI
ncbi:G2/mitotic-specific cyclin-B-like isoform X2 [Symsagittifera roscoffensis]